MSMSLGRKVANSAVALSLVFGLAACETPNETNLKSEIARDMVAASVLKCDSQSDLLNDQKPYAERLYDSIMESSYSAVSFLNANNVTVCLDKRLEIKNTGTFTSDINAVYYGSQKILSLRDDGLDSRLHGGIFKNRSEKNGDYIDAFERNFGGIFNSYASPSDVFGILVGYRSSCGKNCTTEVWRDEGSFWAPSLSGIDTGYYKPPIMGSY